MRPISISAKRTLKLDLTNSPQEFAKKSFKIEKTTTLKTLSTIRSRITARYSIVLSLWKPSCLSPMVISYLSSVFWTRNGSNTLHSRAKLNLSSDRNAIEALKYAACLKMALLNTLIIQILSLMNSKLINLSTRWKERYWTLARIEKVIHGRSYSQLWKIKREKVDRDWLWICWSKEGSFCGTTLLSPGFPRV